MRLPTLVIVSGPPGSGKTTLAHALARAIGCPAISRDEIKEGMAHGLDDFVPEPGDPLTKQTFDVFFAVVGAMVDAGVTVVAEAAFRIGVWKPKLEPFTGRTHLRIVACDAPAHVRRARVEHRAARAAHADTAYLRGEEAFEHIDMPAPTVKVDTTDGYDPAIDDIVTFIGG